MKFPKELYASPGKIALSFVWLFYPLALLAASGAMTSTGNILWRDLVEVLPVYLISVPVLWGQIALLRNRPKETRIAWGVCIAAGVLVLPAYFGLVCGPVAYAVALIVYVFECPRSKISQSQDSPIGSIPTEPIQSSTANELHTTEPKTSGLTLDREDERPRP